MGQPPTIQNSHVPIARGRLWRRAIALLATQPLDFEEESRRLLYGGISIVVVAMLGVFGLRHLLTNSPVEGGLNLLLSVYWVGSLLLLRGRCEGWVFYHLAVLMVGGLFVYFGTLGQEHGHRALWTFCYPLFAIFMAGAKLGLLYTVLLFVTWVGFFAIPPDLTGAAQYSPEFVSRFVACYATMTFMALFAERVRQTYFVALNQHSQQLQSENIELSRQEDRLRDLANRDELTGIANRRAILAELNQQIATAASNGTTLSLALIDVDHFKRINDSHGHAVGDQVLAEFCHLVQGQVRDQDRFGRYGGEEFLLLLPETPANAVAALLERIRAKIEQHRFVRGTEVTASLGATSAEGAKLDADEMLRRADLALYAAKDDGRNLVKIH